MTIDPSTGVRGLEPGRQDLAYASQSCYQERRPHYRAAHSLFAGDQRRFTQPQFIGMFRNLIRPAMLSLNSRRRVNSTVMRQNPYRPEISHG